MKQNLFSSAPHFKDYEYKSLKGRYAHFLSSNKNARRTFVILYGQHATLERIEPIAMALQEFGDVYIVDNPGFGGMDASYKIKQYPSLSFYADHLRHFVTSYIPKDRALTLLGISFGFQIITQALHEHEDLRKRTELSVSFVGFVHPQNFQMPASYSVPLLYGMANLGRSAIGAAVIKFFLKDSFIAGVYNVTKPIQPKFKSLPKEEAALYAKQQAWLWRINDPRTHGATAWDFFKKNDLTSYRINIPVTHIGSPNDHILANERVCAELAMIYTDCAIFDLQLANHAPLDIDTPEKVKELLPKELCTQFSQSINKEAIVV